MRLYELRTKSSNLNDLAEKWKGKGVFIHGTRDAAPPRFSGNTKPIKASYHQPTGIHAFNLDKLLALSPKENVFDIMDDILAGANRYNLVWILQFTGNSSLDLTNVSIDVVDTFSVYLKTDFPVESNYKDFKRVFNQRRGQARRHDPDGWYLFRTLLYLHEENGGNMSTQQLINMFLRDFAQVDMITDYSDVFDYGMHGCEVIFLRPGSYKVVDVYDFVSVERTDWLTGEKNSLSKLDIDHVKHQIKHPGGRDKQLYNALKLAKTLNGNPAKTKQLFMYWHKNTLMPGEGDKDDDDNTLSLRIAGFDAIFKYGAFDSETHKTAMGVYAHGEFNNTPRLVPNKS